jgi:hypothetical protein
LLFFSRVRSFSTGIITEPVSSHNNAFDGFKIDPQWVTGFVDTLSFGVSVTKSKEYKVNWRTFVVFQIGVHISDLPLLLSIQKYFNGIGYITKNLERNTANYIVIKLDDVKNVIISHFVQYPLLTQKRADFGLFKSAVELIDKKEHLLKEGLTKALLNAFPNVYAISRPIVEYSGIQNLNWLAVF